MIDRVLLVDAVVALAHVRVPVRILVPALVLVDTADVVMHVVVYYRYCSGSCLCSYSCSC